MRFLLKVSIPMDKGNAMIKDGSLPRVMKAALGELQPEAAYFGEDNGLRTAFIVVDMKDAAQMPIVGEPFFIGLGANVEFHPVMNTDDLMKAMPTVVEKAKRYAW